MSAFVILISTLPFPEAYKGDVRATMKFMFTEQFSKADSIAQKIKTEMPDSPLGYILHMASLEFYMTDWSTDAPEREFMSEYDAANEMCRKGIHSSSGKEKARWHMFRGAAVGFKAVHYARRYYSKTNVLRALKYAKEALDEFNRAYQLDTTLYDCYLAMGLYDLAMSYMQHKIPWLKGENRRQQGLARLNVAMERSELFKPLAMMAYVYVYSYDHNPDMALQYMRFLKTTYPGSRTLMWLETEVYIENERWFYGLNASKALLEEIEKSQPNCYVNQAEAHLKMGVCLFHLGNRDEAIGHFKTARQLLQQETDPSRAGEVKKVSAKLDDALKQLKIKID